MATTLLRGQPRPHRRRAARTAAATHRRTPSPAPTSQDFTSETHAGSRVVLNIFPSIDTGVCAASVRRFNELAADLDNTVVVCASADLPFALRRFCGAEGIEYVVVGSSFRSGFGTDYGVTMVDGGMRGLLARAGRGARHRRHRAPHQLVDDIGTSPTTTPRRRARLMAVPAQG